MIPPGLRLLLLSALVELVWPAFEPDLSQKYDAALIEYEDFIRSLIHAAFRKQDTASCS